MASRRDKKEILAEYRKHDYEWSLFQEMEIAFCNSMKIEGLDDEVYPPFIMRGLLYNGAVGYVDDDQSYALGVNPGWYWVRPSDFNSEWGFPKSYNLVYGNYLIAKENVFYKDFHLINANATQYAWSTRFLREAKELAELNISEKINTEASRNADLIPVPDVDTEQTLRRAYDNMRNGCATVILSEKAAECLQNKVTNPTPFIADKIHALFEQRFSAALKRCGIVTANDFKKERVQTAEVNAGAGESLDYIHILRDSFNDACERGGIRNKKGERTRMVFNGFAARFDTNGDGVIDELDFEESEEGENG